MKLLKRIEVRILLLLVVAGLVFVLVSNLGDEDGYNDDDPDGTEASANVNPEGRLEILQVEVSRDFSNYKAAVTFSYDNSESKDALSLKEDVTLKDAAGQDVPMYWLASMPPLEPIPAGGKEKGVKTFWIEQRHVEGELWFHVLDAKLRLKTSDPLPADSIENGTSEVFRKSNWTKES